MADVLVDDAPYGSRRLVAGGVALLVAVVAGGTALRRTLPPPPVDVVLTGVSGTALQRDSFVQLRLGLESEQAREVDAALLAVAGTTQPGQHRGAFDDAGRLTVQFRLTPDCAVVAEGVARGELELAVRDAAGDVREARLDVPADGPLGRLLQSTCGR